MADTSQKDGGMNSMIQSLMDTAMNFWQDIGIQQSKMKESGEFSFPFSTATENEEDDRYKTYHTWETTLNNFTALMRLMSSSQNREAMIKGTGTFTEAVMEAVGDSIENITEFQGQLIKSAAKVSEHTKVYNFDDIDREAFESFRSLYRSELQKYLKMPKLGLSREHHEKMAELIDRSTIFYSHLSELLYLFYLPFEKTNRKMQKHTKSMLDKGEFYEDTKQAYNDWMKILEGNFMELLKSSDYTTVLSETIGALASYKDVKNDLVGVFVKDLQIPTNKEMDEVYKDLYQMKRKIRELGAEVAALKNELATQKKPPTRRTRTTTKSRTGSTRKNAAKAASTAGAGKAKKNEAIE